MILGGDAVGYSVKWVTDNLGVTRKALRLLEDDKYQLMPKNKNGQYRDYTDEDIERIWFIKTLQGIGYTLQEISDMGILAENDDWDIQESLTQKIIELEKVIAEKEHHLGYAKAIKFTGKFPTLPKGDKHTNFEEFKKNAINEWNIDDKPQAKLCQDFAEAYISSESEVSEEALNKLTKILGSFDFSDFNSEAAILISALQNSIGKRSNLGANHPEIQTLVKLLHESDMELLSSLISKENIPNFTPKEYANYVLPSYLLGDISKAYEKKLGIDSCIFIADAIAIYGGYKNADEYLSVNS